MKAKRRRLIESAVNRRAKLLENHVLGLGQLPSSKLMKMKWNPVTGKTLREQEAPIAAPEMAAPADPMEALLADMGAMLESWPDKEHPYYADTAQLLLKYTQEM